MKLFLLLFFCVELLFGAKVVHIDKKYQKSVECRVCHKRIVDEWSHSWHAKSHFLKDEYFKKSIEYVSRKTRRSLTSVKIECATCHNPRISVTKTSKEYEIAAVMGLAEGSKADKAVNDDSLSEGINCVVCHNIDKIHDEYTADKRGVNRVEWTKSGTMTGPYSDAVSPYHKTKHHDFMDKTPNRLCFVCHANDRSVHGVVFANMQKEYKGDESCVSCHMGPRHEDVAATYRFNGKVKMRNVRNHTFYGGHVEKMWKGALELNLLKKDGKLLIAINNPQPHNIPSGFGARELLVVVKSMKNHKVVDTKIFPLTQHYISKRGRKTIPHLSLSKSGNFSIATHSTKVFQLPLNSNAERVRVTLYYKLVNDEVRGILKLKDAIWSKKYFIAQKELQI